MHSFHGPNSEAQENTFLTGLYYKVSTKSSELASPVWSCPGLLTLLLQGPAHPGPGIVRILALPRDFQETLKYDFCAAANKSSSDCRI